MTREEAFAALGLDEELNASMPDEAYASFPNASYPPPQIPTPIDASPFFNANPNASRFPLPNTTPVGAPLASQSGQTALNAQKPPLGSPAPLPAPLPLPPLSELQGGPPSAPVTPLSDINTQQFFNPKVPGGQSSLYALPQSQVTPLTGQVQLTPGLMESPPTQTPQENLGTFPTPPPVNTTVPISEPPTVTQTPGQPLAPTVVGQAPNPFAPLPSAVEPPSVNTPPGAVTPTSKEIVDRVLTPNEQLERDYENPMKLVNDAVYRDMQRRRDIGQRLATMTYYNAIARGERPSDVALKGMLDPYTSMFETEAMKLGAETTQQVAAAKKSSAAFERDGRLAKTVRIAALSDPRFETIVQRHAQSAGITPEESKAFLAETTLSGMTPFEINTFLDYASQGQDYSNKAIDGYAKQAQADQTIAMAAKLRLETSDEANLYNAKWSKDSALTYFARKVVGGLPFFSNLGITPEQLNNATYGELAQLSPIVDKAIQAEINRITDNYKAYQQSLMGSDLMVKPTVQTNLLGERVLTPNNAANFAGASEVAALFELAESAYSGLMDLYYRYGNAEFAAAFAGNGRLANQVKQLVAQYRNATEKIMELSPKDVPTMYGKNDILGFLTAGASARGELIQDSMDKLRGFVQKKFEPVVHTIPIGSKKTHMGNLEGNGFVPPNPQLYTPFEMSYDVEKKQHARVYALPSGNFAYYNRTPDGRWDVKIVTPQQRLEAQRRANESRASAAKPYQENAPREFTAPSGP